MRLIAKNGETIWVTGHRIVRDGVIIEETGSCIPGSPEELQAELERAAAMKLLRKMR